MNRIQKKYIQERFIPALAQLGYALKQADNEQLVFNTRNNLHFILYVRKEVVQGFYICGKRMLSIQKLCFLNVSPIFVERLQNNGDLFHFDTKDEFIGILNCIYDLIQRNTKVLLENEDDFLMQKIRQATDLQKQKMECISPKEYLLTELQKRENIRFRENNIIPDSFPPTNTNM